MKQLLVRLEVVELDDHDTNLIPDETTIYKGERAILNNEYNYDNIDKMQNQADEALQKYVCAANNHEDNRDTEYDVDHGTIAYCSLCEVDLEVPGGEGWIPEPDEGPDYDEMIKDEKILGGNQ